MKKTQDNCKRLTEIEKRLKGSGEVAILDIEWLLRLAKAAVELHRSGALLGDQSPDPLFVTMHSKRKDFHGILNEAEPTNA